MEYWNFRTLNEKKTQSNCSEKTTLDQLEKQLSYERDRNHYLKMKNESLCNTNHQFVVNYETLKVQMNEIIEERTALLKNNFSLIYHQNHLKKELMVYKEMLCKASSKNKTLLLNLKTAYDELVRNTNCLDEFIATIQDRAEEHLIVPENSAEKFNSVVLKDARAELSLSPQLTKMHPIIENILSPVQEEQPGLMNEPCNNVGRSRLGKKQFMKIDQKFDSLADCGAEKCQFTEVQHFPKEVPEHILPTLQGSETNFFSKFKDQAKTISMCSADVFEKLCGPAMDVLGNTYTKDSEDSKEKTIEMLGHHSSVATIQSEMSSMVEEQALLQIQQKQDPIILEGNNNNEFEYFFPPTQLDNLDMAIKTGTFSKKAKNGQPSTPLHILYSKQNSVPTKCELVSNPLAQPLNKNLEEECCKEEFTHDEIIRIKNVKSTTKKYLKAKGKTVNKMKRHSLGARKQKKRSIFNILAQDECDEKTSDLDKKIESKINLNKEVEESRFNLQYNGHIKDEEVVQNNNLSSKRVTRSRSKKKIETNQEDDTPKILRTRVHDKYFKQNIDTNEATTCNIKNKLESKKMESTKAQTRSKKKPVQHEKNKEGSKSKTQESVIKSDINKISIKNSNAISSRTRSKRNNTKADKVEEKPVNTTRGVKLKIGEDQKENINALKLPISTPKSTPNASQTINFSESIISPIRKFDTGSEIYKISSNNICLSNNENLQNQMPSSNEFQYFNENQNKQKYTFFKDLKSGNNDHFDKKENLIKFKEFLANIGKIKNDKGIKLTTNHKEINKSQSPVKEDSGISNAVSSALSSLSQSRGSLIRSMENEKDLMELTV